MIKISISADAPEDVRQVRKLVERLPALRIRRAKQPPGVGSDGKYHAFIRADYMRENDM